MQYLGVTDPEVYARGAIEIIRERAGDLTEEQLHRFIQFRRGEMKEIQEEITAMERIALDASIREKVRKRRNVETRLDEYGKPYEVTICHDAP
jgi:hypothetical protein